MPTDIRRLTVTSCASVYEGTNTKGDPFTIFEVEASDENGVAISLPLRSFHDLPLVAGEFTVERYEKNNRTSYTLKPVRGARSKAAAPGVSTAEFASLTARVEALEQAQPPAF